MPTGKTSVLLKLAGFVIAPFPGLGTKISSCLLKSAIPLRTSVQFHILQQPDRYQNPLSIIQCFLYIVYLTEIGSTPSNRLPPAYPQKQTNAFLYIFAIGSYAVYFICSSCEGETRNDFPKVLLIFRSGSISFVNERLNTFNPLKQILQTKP
jgi:hypothetical protein